MSESGIFVYTKIDDTTAALGTGNLSVDGNGFVEKTAVKGVVIVPSFFGNLRVVSVKSYATRGCHQITKFILPETITTLEYGSFTYMNGLKEAIFPASIITIKDNNDFFCNAEKIYFRKGSRVETIGKLFLQNSYVVKEFIFPSSVKSIGGDFAYKCPSLQHVSFCGKTDFSGISSAFVSCENFISVFVSYEYQGLSFGGKTIEIKEFYSCFPVYDICLTKKCIKSQHSFSFTIITLLYLS